MRILLCIGGLPYDEFTLCLGAYVAQATTSALTILHVVRDEREQRAGMETLRRASGALEGLTIAQRLRQGRPTQEIINEIRAGAYDLVIVGAHREVGLPQRILGTVAFQVARRSPISVLVSRKGYVPWGRILICTGGLDIADPVIRVGAQLAHAISAQVTLLHVASPAPSMYTGLAQIEETLSELLRSDTPIAQHLREGAQTLDRHQVDGEVKLRVGVVADEIVREAHEGDHSLVVIGAAGTTGPFLRVFLGNVTNQVVEEAPCSILVVKGDPGRK